MNEPKNEDGLPLSEYKKRYADTLKKIEQKTGKKVDLILSTTSSDANWLHSMREKKEETK